MQTASLAVPSPRVPLPPSLPRTFRAREPIGRIKGYGQQPCGSAPRPRSIVVAISPRIGSITRRPRRCVVHDRARGGRLKGEVADCGPFSLRFSLPYPSRPRSLARAWGAPARPSPAHPTVRRSAALVGETPGTGRFQALVAPQASCRRDLRLGSPGGRAPWAGFSHRCAPGGALLLPRPCCSPRRSSSPSSAVDSTLRAMRRCCSRCVSDGTMALALLRRFAQLGRAWPSPARGAAGKTDGMARADLPGAARPRQREREQMRRFCTDGNASLPPPPLLST